MSIPTIFIDARTPGDQIQKLIRRAADELGLEFQQTTDADAVLEELRENATRGELPPLLVLLGPHLTNPLSVARQVHQISPAAYLILLAEGAQSTTLNQSVSPISMIGTNWTIANLDNDGLVAIMQSAARSIRQRQQLRTTLDRMNSRLASKPPSRLDDQPHYFESDRFLASILHSARDAIIATDKQGIIKTWTRAAEQLFDLTERDAIGRPIHTIAAGSWAEQLGDLINKLSEGHLYGGACELICRRFNGTLFEADLTLTPIREHTGRQIGISAVVRDISKRKQVETALRESEKRFRDLIELSFDWYWEQDENYRFTSISGISLDHLEHRSDRAVGKARWEIGTLEPVQGDWQEHKVILDRREPFRDFAIKYWTKNHETGYMIINGKPIFDEAGNFKGYHGTGKDITEQKRAEAAIVENEARLRTTLETSQDCIVGMDQTGRIIDFNPAAEQTFGYSKDAVIGKKMSDVLVPVQARDAHDRGLERYLATGAATMLGRRVELSALHQNGSEFPVELALTVVQTGKGPMFTGFIRDLRERKAAEALLLRLAQYDSLTKLPNRALFRDRLSQTLAQAKRNVGTTAVLFIDLDRFKMVNDTLGHGAGDQLLRQVSERLAACLRQCDTVGRLGGDEFAIILAELGHAEDAGLVAQKIKGSLESPFQIGADEAFVSASIGIAVAPEDGSTPDALLQNADIAMYQAKVGGRSSYRFYAPEMNNRAMEHLKLDTDLRHALVREEFMLLYQPRIDLRSRAAVGFEALIRWRHPARGLVGPSAFISQLEDNGMIVAVGNWVLKTACEQLSQWRQAGLTILPIAINCSPRQLQYRDLVESVEGILKANGIEGRLIELEITESSLMHDRDAAVDILRRLKVLGIGVAIDDFGTGYSSLSYLKRFPLDCLKIDQSFVRDFTTDPDDAAIARAIITLAHQLGLRVVAEGVETEEQLKFLADNECDEAQGFYFSRPISAEEAAEFLQKCPSAQNG